ncbi:hypothetical protein D3C71_1188250 [compost metagenome]
MSARKAQADTKTVFELKRTAEIVVFDFGVGKQRHANTKLYIRFYILAGKLVNQHGGEGQAVVAGGLVTLPVGVSPAPVPGQSTDVGLPPTLVPIELQAQTISHGRLAGLTDREFHACCLCSETVPHQRSRNRGQTE